MRIVSRLSFGPHLPYYALFLSLPCFSLPLPLPLLRLSVRPFPLLSLRPFPLLSLPLLSLLLILLPLLLSRIARRDHQTYVSRVAAYADSSILDGGVICPVDPLLSILHLSGRVAPSSRFVGHGETYYQTLPTGLETGWKCQDSLTTEARSG